MAKSVVGMKETPAGGKPLVLPILKYSYATSSADRNSPLGWTHLSGGADLVAIFDHGTIVDQRSGETRGSRYFKVQRGLEILEELNLGSLAQDAARGSSAHSSPQDSKSSIAVLVKSPCLAIRYPTRINQVRRCQVKFSSEADYYRAVSILREVGCPITESSTTGPGHPHASATSYQAELGSSSAMTTTTSTSGLMSEGAASSIHSAAFAPPSFPDVAPSSGVQEPRPSSIGSSSTLRATPSVSGYNHQMQPTASAMAWRSPTDNRNNAVGNNNDRPSTAPPFPDPTSLNQILPPKRELPFAKPGSTTKRPRNHPLLSTTSSTPSPQVGGISSAVPSPAGPAAGAKPAAQSIQQPRSVTAAAAYFNRPHNNISCADGPMEPATQNPSPLTQLQTTLPTQHDQHDHHYQHSANAPSTRRAPLTTPSPGFINQVSTGGPHADITAAAAAAASTTISITSAAQPTSTPAPPFAFPPPPAEPTPPDLSTYLSTPTPERTAQLESWMCAQLESEGFLALCQDVEGLWRRVVYGL